MSRLSFRPRPLDIHKKLPIVKSVKDIDNDEGAGVSRTVQHNHIALDAENELVLSTPTRRGGGAEIPTPNFEVVESYERDYTRSFHQPPSYLRGRGARSEATEYVEYDLDDEDEDWLLQLNAERKILFPERFEWMLYKMEVMDHKSRERTGAVQATQGVYMPAVLHSDVAMDAIRFQSSRHAVLCAVYEYWKAKRDRWQKPILRRLQPPPSVNDTNPFNVFRPREKVHRPHTRRMQRRENDVSSFEKLRQIRQNLEQSRSLMVALQMREEKKRELVECEATLQQVQIRLKHDACVDDDGLLATNSSMLATRSFAPLKWGEDHQNLPYLSNIGMKTTDQINGHGGSFGLPSELPTLVADGAPGDHLVAPKHKKKKRALRVPPPRSRPGRRIKVMDTLEPVLLFTKPLDPEKLAAAGIQSPKEPLENGLTTAPYCLHGRIGRGGRIVFDRWNSLYHTPISRPGFPLTVPLPTSPAVERIHMPPPKLDLDAVTRSHLHSGAAAAVLDHTSSTNALPP